MIMFDSIDVIFESITFFLALLISVLVYKNRQKVNKLSLGFFFFAIGCFLDVLDEFFISGFINVLSKLFILVALILLIYLFLMLEIMHKR